jgi:6-phosphofructokinase
VAGTFDLRGEVLPYLDVARFYGMAPAQGRRRSLIVVRDGSLRIGLVVDRLLGEHQTVIKPLAGIFQPIKALAKRLLASEKRGKLSNILIVAEGSLHGGAFETAKKLGAITGHDYKVMVLGHMQRGGTPTAVDRILATELGSFAVEQLILGKTGLAVGKRDGRLVTTPLKEAVTRRKKISNYLLKLLPILSV